MPIAHIYLVEGRPEEQLRQAIADVTEALSNSLQAPTESIKVLIHETPSTHWSKNGKPIKDYGR